MTFYSHRFSGTLPAGDIFNFGWTSQSVVPIGTEHAAGDAWLAQFWAGYAAVSSTATTVLKHTTYQLGVALPLRTVAVLESDVTLVGTDASHSVPQDSAVVVSLRSNLPGPPGRGRIYLPPVCVDSLTAIGELTSGAQAATLAALSSAWGASVPSGSTPVVLNRTTGVGQQILRFGVGTLLDRQKRRVNKVNTVRVFDAMP